MSATGKARRLARILHPVSAKTVIVPVDDSLIAGPTHGLQYLASKLKDVVLGEPNAIIAFAGLVRRYDDVVRPIPVIINLTASTTRSQHTRKVLISTVEDPLMY